MALNDLYTIILQLLSWWQLALWHFSYRMIFSKQRLIVLGSVAATAWLELRIAASAFFNNNASGWFGPDRVRL